MSIILHIHIWKILKYIFYQFHEIHDVSANFAKKVYESL